MLLLAAGAGKRFGGETPKVYLECAGRTLVQRCLDRLKAVTADREIILATSPEFADAFDPSGITRVVEGGATRQQSMRRALAASDPACPLVLVHDAARPFLPVAATRRALERAAAVGAACLAVPAPDTLKRVDAHGRITETVDRTGIWLAQTPQIARRALLEAALESAERDGFDGTDEMSLLERTGVTVEVVEGSHNNLKITTPADLALAALIAAAEDGS